MSEQVIRTETREGWTCCEKLFLYDSEFTYVDLCTPERRERCLLTGQCEESVNFAKMRFGECKRYRMTITEVQGK